MPSTPPSSPTPPLLTPADGHTSGAAMIAMREAGTTAAPATSTTAATASATTAPTTFSAISMTAPVPPPPFTGPIPPPPPRTFGLDARGLRRGPFRIERDYTAREVEVTRFCEAVPDDVRVHLLGLPNATQEHAQAHERRIVSAISRINAIFTRAEAASFRNFADNVASCLTCCLFPVVVRSNYARRMHELDRLIAELNREVFAPAGLLLLNPRHCAKQFLETLAWPTGAVITQACHAATAVLHKHRAHPNTQAYLANLDQMHKVTLEVKNEQQLTRLAEQLDEADLKHVVWREQPENIVTALATVPYRKADVGDAFKKCQLFR